MAHYEDNRRFGMTKLGEGNYHVWKQRTELWLRRENLWDHVIKPPPDEITEDWLSRDSQAKATIGLLVEDKFLVDINTQNTAKETWERLRSIHQQTSLGARLTLYRTIFSSKYTTNMNMIDHITGILNAAGKLEDSGHTLLDEIICGALLGSLPKDYDGLITSIEGRDSKSITVDYVREKIIEESKKKTGQGYYSSHDTKAMPTQTNRNNWSTKKQVSCFYCHKVGHIRRDCRLLANHNAHKEHQPAEHRELTHHTKYTPRSSNQRTREPINDNLSDNTHENNHRAMNIGNATVVKGPKHGWIIDTGAEDHMSSDESLLHHIQPLTQPITVMTAGGEEHVVTKKGRFDLTLTNTEGKSQTLELKEVLVVNTLSDDLISISKLDDQGYRVTFGQGKCWIDGHGNKMLLGNLQQNLYITTVQRTLATQRGGCCRHIWHNRLGHRNMTDIKRMQDESMAEDMKTTTCDQDGICTPCILSKKSNTPFVQQRTPRSHRPFEVLHSDLCGPIVPTSLGGNKYSLTIIDDFSGFSTVYMIRTKDETHNKIKEFIEHGINVHHRRPRAFISDGGGEYCNHLTEQYFHEKGIRHIITLPHTPQENGKSERYNRTLMEATRTLLKQAKLPKTLWGEMALTSTYLLNRVCQQGNSQTPHEMWLNKKPNLKHLRTLGLNCYYYDTTPHKQKLDDRAIHGILVGYGQGSQFYRIWNPQSNKIITSRSVTFDIETCPINNQEDNVYLENLPEVSEVYTPTQPLPCIEPTTNIRRSSRGNKGVPPRVLTYNDASQPENKPQDWFSDHNYNTDEVRVDNEH